MIKKLINLNNKINNIFYKTYFAAELAKTSDTYT